MRRGRGVGGPSLERINQKILGGIHTGGSSLTYRKFASGTGQPLQGQEAVIPICTVDKRGRLECIGTGFFIGVHGIFVTAKHVVGEVLDEDGNPILDEDKNFRFGLKTFHLIPPNSIVIREIIKISFHGDDDVAVGALGTMVDQKTGEPLRNKILQLTARTPGVGERIATWAYPNSVAEYNGKEGSLSVVPKIYEGEIEDEHREGRGWGKVPGRCYQTNLGIERGTSGGPVFDDEGCVFAINSTGFDGTDLAYVSHVQSIGGLTLPLVQTDDGKIHEKITISELIDQGSIKVAHIDDVRAAHRERE